MVIDGPGNSCTYEVLEWFKIAFLKVNLTGSRGMSRIKTIAVLFLMGTAMAGVLILSQFSVASTPKKYQYKLEKIPPWTSKGASTKPAEDAINQIAAQGWRLVRTDCGAFECSGIFEKEN